MPKKPTVSLAKSHPKIAAEADGWDPTKVSFGMGQKLAWKCKEDNRHRWEASPNQRTSKGAGCPYCANQKVLVGVNDLRTTHPEIANEASGWDPSTLTAGSGNIMLWKCRNSAAHNWKSRVVARTNGHGCPFCTNKKVLPGFNDLLTTDSELAREAIGWDPSKFTAWSNKKVQWKCKVNEMHLWTASIDSRKRGRNCPYCQNDKVLIGFNDLATTHPEIAREAFNWDPTTVTAGSEKKRVWQCQNNPNHKWTAIIKSRKAGKGCPSCAIGGFDPNLEGYLYFLTQPNWNMYQIGITNYPKDRLQRHRRLGWQIIEVRGPMDGHLTQQWETAILRMLKAKGADLANSKIAGKFDGYSEAWSQNKFQVESIKELMQMTEEFEDSEKQQTFGRDS